MSKLIFLVAVIATLAININADANADADAGAFGAPQFPNYFPVWNFPGFPQFPAFPPMTSPDDIKNMAPQGPNSHVVGAYVSSNNHKERVVTNNDGKATDNTYKNQ